MIMTFGIINTFSMRHSDGWSHKGSFRSVCSLRSFSRNFADASDFALIFCPLDPQISNTPLSVFSGGPEEPWECS